MSELTLRDVLRTGTVKRWHMCRVGREQTLAEHMYRVTMLAKAVYAEIGRDNADYSERQMSEITEWALEHDKPEVCNGDVPTPVKDRIRAIGSKILEELDHEASPAHTAHQSGIKGTLTETVVKLADLMEAIVFLQDEGIGAHTESVRRTVVKRFNLRLEKARKDHPKWDWSRVDAMLTEVIYGQESSL